jgi:hypothetical protein
MVILYARRRILLKCASTTAAIVVATVLCTACGKRPVDESVDTRAASAQPAAEKASNSTTSSEKGVHAALQTAYSSFQANNWDAAESVLRKALDAQPGHPLLLNNLSVVLARLGRCFDAMASLKAALPAAGGYTVDKKVISLVLKCPSLAGNEYLFKLSYAFPPDSHPSRQDASALPPQDPWSTAAADLRTVSLKVVVDNNRADLENAMQR